MKLTKGLLFLIAAFAFALPAVAKTGDMSGMDMDMPQKPAQFAPTRMAYTTNHQFLVKLIAVPNPIPYEKYFKMRFEVYDGRHPSRQLKNAKLAVYAGMRHGMKNGFAHGMQSSPAVRDENGVYAVSGMYFHMMGPWTLQATVHDGNRQGVADFQLPCCGQ